ncbi:hypothetical protein SS50377_23943 [Spironucleus salmonicida]|uniref:Uncharacterized protein n=1 Tax=Spironucleus salmonicida TaxID=348837 RepID=V6LX89_9EUKA|nr:hypothetical protein SS50377_23943 [Spironucleus salmonicida]|eukprot:EST48336.1 Hypothetical protein SS50377_11541 [Spironucleus salmonicida]
MGIQLSYLENTVQAQLTGSGITYKEHQPIKMQYSHKDDKISISSQSNSNSSIVTKSIQKLPSKQKLINYSSYEHIQNNSYNSLANLTYPLFLETVTEAKNRELSQSSIKLSRLLSALNEDVNDLVID